MTIFIKASKDTWIKTTRELDSTEIASGPQPFGAPRKFQAAQHTILQLDNLQDLGDGYYQIDLAGDLNFGWNRLYAFGLHWSVIDTDVAALLAQEAPAAPTSFAAEQQQKRLLTYLSSPADLDRALKTKVRYFSQRDNYTQPHRTCNSSANAMYLDWLLRATGKPQLPNDDEYLRKVLSYGDTTFHINQTRAISAWGFETTWATDANADLVAELLRLGFPVVVNIKHRGLPEKPQGGHVIILIGLRGDDWIAHDPYGSLNSKYRVTNGAYSKIADREFLSRWEGGYRLLT